MRSVRVTFGDGTAPVDLGGVAGNAITAGHVYASAGAFLVEVTATDSGTGTATASTQIVVAAPGAPTVSLTASPNPVAGVATTFTITAAPATGGNIQNVHVTFGDGTAPVDLGAVSGSTSTQHVYAAAGTYTVSVIVTDGGGGTATASTQVVVTAPGAPTVSVTASANPVSGSVTTFTIAAAPGPGSNTTIQNVRVTFGDGSAPGDDLGAISGSTTTQHVYAGERDLRRFGDRDGGQWRDGNRVHAGRGRRTGRTDHCCRSLGVPTLSRAARPPSPSPRHLRRAATPRSRTSG